MTSLGLKVSARAIATVCCWPPENEPTERLIDGRCAPEPLDHLCRLAVHLGLVDKSRKKAEQLLRRLAAEEDVGGHVLLLGQRQVLVDHLDAELAPLAGIERQDVLAVEFDRAGIGAIDAGDGLHQRRLAGAIVADEADHLARLDRQVDAMQHVDGAKALADALQGEKGHTRDSFRTWYWSMNTARISTAPIAICW